MSTHPTCRKSKFLRLLSFIFFVLFFQACQNTEDTKEILSKNQQLSLLLDSLEHNYWKNPEGNLSVANEAIRLATESGDSTNLAKALLKMAGCYQLLDSSSASLFYYNKALQAAQHAENDSLVAKILNGIANHFLRKEDYKEAVTYLHEALKVSDKVKYKHVTGLIYNGLGLVNISLAKYDTAIACFIRSRNICQERGDLANVGGINMNIANCYAEKEEFRKALSVYTENLPILEEVSDTAQIILAYINMGTLNRGLKEYGKTIQNLNQALEFLDYFPNNSLLCTTFLELGKTYLEIPDSPKAQQYLLKSLALSGGTLSKSNTMEALRCLSELEARNNNPGKALDYYQRYTVVKDSVMNDETRKSVAEIQLKYDVQKKEYENELLSKKIEIRNRQNSSLILSLISLIIIMILTGILIWLVMKNLRKSNKLQELENIHLQQKIESDIKINELEKLKLQAEIESKNKELTTTSFQLITKNKILADIQKLVNDFLKAGTLDEKSHTTLRKIIEENLNSDKEWEQFKDLFEKVHQNFFSGLKTSFPDLSENELRLCAYIRINLQNKEIARIINVEPATIITARYRIRKKLGIDNKVILEDFLRSF